MPLGFLDDEDLYWNRYDNLEDYEDADGPVTCCPLCEECDEPTCQCECYAD